tara:strand:- start:466 stop:576 length:111 start_codon:yes stop_codon:yes gene_type:complete
MIQKMRNFEVDDYLKIKIKILFKRLDFADQMEHIYE